MEEWSIALSARFARNIWRDFSEEAVMKYYHGEINTPFEKHIDIYIAETDYQFAEWKVWDEAKLYGQRIVAEMGDPEIDGALFVEECEGWIIDETTEEWYAEARRDGEWCV
jgi:hypothetical protein